MFEAVISAAREAHLLWNFNGVIADSELTHAETY